MCNRVLSTPLEVINRGLKDVKRNTFCSTFWQVWINFVKLSVMQHFVMHTLSTVLYAHFDVTSHFWQPNEILLRLCSCSSVYALSINMQKNLTKCQWKLARGRPFRSTQIVLTFLMLLLSTRTCTYQEVINFSFCEDFVYELNERPHYQF